MEAKYIQAIATLLKASNDFILEAVQAESVNEIPIEKFSYDIVMALVDIREFDNDGFADLDSLVDGMLYSHASAHEFELMLTRVNVEDLKDQYLECDAMHSRNIMEQIAKDLTPVSLDK